MKQHRFVRRQSQFAFILIKFAKFYKREDKFKDRLASVKLLHLESLI